MTKEQRNKITYDLSLEYAKRLDKFFEDKSAIPEIVDEFADIYERFDNALQKCDKLNKLF